MIREKIARLSRRVRRNIKSVLLVWLPAVVVVTFVGYVLISVATSKDASFKPCTDYLAVCAGNVSSEQSGFSKLSRLAKCSVETAMCDVRILYLKVRGDYQPPAWLNQPPVDEKADRELFEKLTSEEFLERRFSEMEKERAAGKDVHPLSKKELVDYMKRLRAERISFEKEQDEKRRAIAEQTEPTDKLSGQKTK